MKETEAELLTVDEAAGVLRVHRSTVLRYIRSGALRAGWAGGGYRITRANMEECMRTLARRQIEGSGR